MKKRVHLIRRFARLAKCAGIATVLAAGLCLGTGTAAHAAASPLAPLDAATVSQFKLHLLSDNTGAIKAEDSPTSGLAPVALDFLAGKGADGKAGLCFPEPFNPGVDADGYCWNNAVDDSGSNDWDPQGFSVPHTASADGTYSSRRWEATSWHGPDDTESKIRFVDRSSSTPNYEDVLLVTPAADGSVSPLAGNHGDGLVWFGDNLLIANGRSLYVAKVSDLHRDAAEPDGFAYVLPIRYAYNTLSAGDTSCLTLDSPCLNGLSFDREHSALTSNEFYASQADGRIVRWPFDTSTGLPQADSGSDTTVGAAATATAAWVSPVWAMQGVLYAKGTFYISGMCPGSFDTGYRTTPGADTSACVHTATSGTAPSVLTAVPDMTQNIDYDASTDRIRGVSEVGQAGETYPERLVFDFAPTARAITTVRLRNAGTGKCLTPYGSSLNNGADITQWDCNGKSAQNWYWDGSEIRNFQSNRCLTVYGGSTTPGAVATQWTCDGGTAEQWTRVAASGGSELVNGNSKQCLTVYGGSGTNGADATQWTCDTSDPLHSWVGYTP
ncbi:Ricin-type beta-trefoil lectin domain-containing protein [Actinacidiphila yanglinensis]|uniref:Ricin-type beta-trefoil lectin domain-containing protein n=1 Tax=Actinacidiphila yanglinensis TaxID=310779 RepID=A0A1H6DFS0_9ACTN|nr:RICIN domain-containing protein [Actinacidiphila yanglinensis]SEG84297.1 Ricin-type beta-trefoil lectin domain-containing protein [Actinacidiphila yanglinensis]